MKIKTIVAVVLTMALCVLPTLNGTVEHSTHVQAQANITIKIEGATLPLTTAPIAESGTILVPLGEITKALHAEVTYLESTKGTQTVRIIRNEREAELTIGSKLMKVNEKQITLHTAPRIVKRVLMVPLREISEALGTIVYWNGVTRTVTIQEPKKLPTVDSTEKLIELLKQSSSDLYAKGALTGIDSALANKENSISAEPTSPAPNTTKKDDYSKTNVQVDGVDEADWAKTDGRYIYQISGTRIFITDISNPHSPKLSAQLEYTAKDNFTPLELYVDEKQLVVIGQENIYTSYTTHDQPIEEPAISENISTNVSVPVENSKNAMIGIWPPYQTKSIVKTFIYELNKTGEPKLTRQLEQEGSYLSSRKIDSSLYIVTNKHNYIYQGYDIVASSDDPDVANAFEPIYRDSATSKKQLTLPLNQIRYFPEPTNSSMMIVGSVDLNESKQQLQLSAFLGAGETMYASEKHLYIAQSHYKEKGTSYEQETQFHKFRLDQGQVVYVGAGTVPGQLLNQFSMDEHEGYFRVALTKGNMWATGEQGSTNNIYVLDESLATVGKLEGLAPGERIYSARFMGKRAYMVTFRNVDPLFAIDLSKPTKPTVLGQLKIPGYSDYLHPYDDNHLIGFGQDTVEIPSKGTGQDESIAITQGLKIALFDVTDVNYPKEKFKEVIGDRGTHSELLQDHKALLFSKEKGLMAFPVQLHEIKTSENGTKGDILSSYGQFTYQGAYVYKIDLKSGFKLRGRISHLTEEDMKKSGQYGFDYTKSVKRILYAGDTLYTLSEAQLRANDLNSLNERGTLTYPALP
ncbi:beta-propeller domain-containing protein [Paenibacillus sp. GSMTC-2017]|uniref:beta-propeller domain-containing protein n=1 Tax=Paenibacillus sp. GSMTC-2017 TaxID=2794350 RepID=UPI0018D8AFFC|nr:beta-propeller domain-containing protein [Paenibacillus sp. GSMTC-2017]MBH5319994.1 beta-propeller domain-containing protein [Paenibacillus sp. GSMTC-2017]